MGAMSDTAVGANAERSRRHNRQVLLGQVRAAGRIGRAEIARASGLSTQAVSNIIANLLDDGLIMEQGRHTAGRGLPSVQYVLNPDGGFALGIDIRPDAVFAVLLNICGKTVAAERCALQSADRHSVTTAVIEVRDTIMRVSEIPSARILGVGVVMPGPFGATSIRGGVSDLANWDDTPPDQWFSEALDLPVVVENDANAAAIAERISGVAQGLETYAFVYFGNGIGLGTVYNGKLMAGAYGNAGEIGHMLVPYGGQIVPLESVVSRLSVRHALQMAGIKADSGVDLERLYAARNPTLLGWLDAAAEPLSAAVAMVENLFDPQAVILGGAMPDALLDHLLGAVRLPDTSVSNRADRVNPRLLRGASGRMTATLGAAALVINQVFTPKIAVQSQELRCPQ